MLKLEKIIAGNKALVPPKTVDGPPIPRAVWEGAVGTRIARRAEPVRLHKGVLYVRVSSSAWANELALLAGDILCQLGESGIEASALRFDVGTLSTPQPKRAKPKTAAPKNAPLPPALAPCVATVEDDELRTALRDAAAKTLALQK